MNSRFGEDFPAMQGRVFDLDAPFSDEDPSPPQTTADVFHQQQDGAGLSGGGSSGAGYSGNGSSGSDPLGAEPTVLQAEASWVTEASSAQAKPVLSTPFNQRVWPEPAAEPAQPETPAPSNTAPPRARLRNRAGNTPGQNEEALQHEPAAADLRPAPSTTPPPLPPPPPASQQTQPAQQARPAQQTQPAQQARPAQQALQAEQTAIFTAPAEAAPVATPAVFTPASTPAASQAAVSAVPVRVLLETALRARASDVHLTEELPPQMRVDGSLARIPGGEACVTSSWFHSALTELMSEKQLDQLANSDEIDFSVAVDGIARFRVNVFRQLGKLAAAMRFIPDETKPLEDLGVPRIAADLVTRPRGLVLVTGPTGSGKSTTLAAMIDLVNRKLPTHIVTMEDPVEFRHTSRTALIHQREIGSDTASFAEAMRRVLRQDPDIILIGELRDPESIASALTAAETGHLVLSTLHTQSAAKSINRIVDAFPPAQQAQVRTQLGDALQGIITQTLLPKATGGGRVIATEVLVNTPAIANLIREGEASQVYSMMQAGGELGMHTLDQDLKRLVEKGDISLDLAQSRAQDPKSIVEGVRVRSGLSEETWMQDMGIQNGAGGWTQ